MVLHGTLHSTRCLLKCIRHSYLLRGKGKGRGGEEEGRGTGGVGNMIKINVNFQASWKMLLLWSTNGVAVVHISNTLLLKPFC